MLGFQFRSAPVELIRCIMYILLGWYLDKVEISKKHVVIFDAFSILIMVGTSVFGYAERKKFAPRILWFIRNATISAKPTFRGTETNT